VRVFDGLASLKISQVVMQFTTKTTNNFARVVERPKGRSAACMIFNSTIAGVLFLPHSPRSTNRVTARHRDCGGRPVKESAGKVFRRPRSMQCAGDMLACLQSARERRQAQHGTLCARIVKKRRRLHTRRLKLNSERLPDYVRGFLSLAHHPSGLC